MRTSDLLDLGTLLVLLDADVIERIGSEAMRRASPILIRNSCFAAKYQAFPGFVTPPTFQQACMSRMVPEDLKAFNDSLTTYKGLLLAGSTLNVQLALNVTSSKKSESVTSREAKIVTTTTTTTTTAKPVDPVARRAFTTKATVLL